MLGKTPDKNKKNANMSLVSDDLDSSLTWTSSINILLDHYQELPIKTSTM